MQKEIPSQFPQITKPQIEPSEEVPPEEFPADKTANWQTYRNEEFGFEVKYFDKYSLELRAVENDSIVLLFKLGDVVNVWSIRVALFIRDTDKKNVFELGSFMNSEYIKIGSQNVLRLLPDTPPFTDISYVFVHKGKEYDIQVLSINPEIMKDADQILSTFRFIE